MKKKIIIILSIILTIFIICLFALNFIGNKIFDELIDSQIEAIKSDSTDNDIFVSSDDDQTNAITVEQLEAAKENVSETDKIKAAGIIMKRLSTDEINELRKMANGGITAEEKRKAKELIYDRLTDNEIHEIEEMYKKYIK